MNVKKEMNIRWHLVLYDLLVICVIEGIMLAYYRSALSLQLQEIAYALGLSLFFTLGARFIGKIYQQIWRYGGIQCFVRLILTDVCAFVPNFAVIRLLPGKDLPFTLMLSMACMVLLASLTMRMLYRYACKCHTRETVWGRFLELCLRVFAQGRGTKNETAEPHRIKIAIVGAGNVGVSLAEELAANPAAAYQPRCFVDIDKAKAGRSIHGIPVLLECETTLERMKEYEIQEVVVAVPDLPDDQKKRLAEFYLKAGYKIKSYDYPVIQTAGGKRQMRDFDIEDLLFRKPVTMTDEKTSTYYRGKVILVTGGGGSIGSELCRRLALMAPRQIVVLDICENGAYDIQQELKIAYGAALDLRVEIVSITNRRGMERVFETYHPQIVINAAAHKHVPLMEHNCVEAVENNVFGLEVLVELCEKYGTERFMMVSTDKAVNPTNVMGATKRMCEMIVQSASVTGHVKYSATRFGNVLGSAGSVIPLFRKQIAAGGPVTLTDRRIIRYFMTIPEASQLVLESGALADNGELFVLDMGQPVKILDLAENMIRLSGVPGIEIVETGLRPGEKLYEELLVRTETLDKTENDMIYIERDQPLSGDEIRQKLDLLRAACATNDDDKVRAALHEAVPTFRTPEEVNAEAESSEEMKNQLVIA